MKKLTLAFLTFYSCALCAEIISQTVADIDKKQLTSREVILSALIDECRQNQCKSDQLELIAIDSDKFANLVSVAIFERLAFLESGKMFKKEIKPLETSLLKEILKTKTANKYRYTSVEVQVVYQIKLLSEEYIKFKNNNLNVYISDTETINEFELNENKYKDKKFADVKVKIKQELTQLKKMKRLEQWVVSMQKKYKVKQMLN